MTAAIGIRFDIDKIKNNSYGYKCWETLWRAIDPKDIGIASLREGDTQATLMRSENVYCIAIQTTGNIERIKHVLSQNEAFKRVCANPMFTNNISKEPLMNSGRITSNGDLVAGDITASLSALEAIKRKREQSSERDNAAAIQKNETAVQNVTDRRFVLATPEKVKQDTCCCVAM